MNRIIPIITMAIAGLIHVWIVPEHWGHAKGHGLFFLTIGIVQIGWSAAFWKSQSASAYRWGIFLSTGLIALWIMTRFFPAPFSHGPEPWSEGLIVKAAELITSALLLAMALRRGVGIGPVRCIVFAIILGIFVYLLGRMAGPLFPSLQEHGEEHEQSHPAQIGHD